MDEKPRRENKGKAWAAVLIAALLMLPILYVVSVGPAAWLVVRGWIGMSTYRSAYAPLVVAEERSEGWGEIIGRYRQRFVEERVWRRERILWTLWMLDGVETREFSDDSS